MKRRTDAQTKRTRNGKSPRPASVLMSAHELHELIALRAFEIYSDETGIGGDELSNWLRAEGEIMSSLQDGSAAGVPSHKPAEGARDGTTTRGPAAAVRRTARKKAGPKSAVA